MRQQVGAVRADVVSTLSGEQAVIPLIENGLLEITRAPAVATFTLSRKLSDDEMLHPWLVPAAATTNAWHGRRVLHGGLVTNGTRALGIVGDKEAGRSTLLAWLAFEAGLSVMCDDLIVVDGDTVFAGPRCIDLRQGSVDHLPDVVGATLVREGTRLRLPLPSGPATAQLVGLAVLEWSADTGVRPVPASARLPHILPHAFTEGVPAGLEGVLGFARYRMWRLARPRDWSSLAASAQLIRELLGG